MPAMSFTSLLAAFSDGQAGCDARLLMFTGVEGDCDVYNCSAPFQWGGRTHLYGRIEKRSEWDSSCSRVFVEIGADTFTLLPEAITRQLSDPCVAKVGSEFVLGGTQIVKNVGKVCNHFCDFYRSETPERPVYFTTGPDRARNVRLVSLSDGRVGVFVQLATALAGTSASTLAFATAPRLTDVGRHLIAAAEAIPADAFLGAVGGVNQAYLLSSGRIGCLAHHSADEESECCATAFVFDPVGRSVSGFRILATQACFPDCPSKLAGGCGRAVPSGIVVHKGGKKCDLYCGVGDTSEGRIAIDYPFEGSGEIVVDLDY